MQDRYLFRGKRIDDGEWVPYPECNTYGANENGEICSFDYKHTGKIEKLVQNEDKDGYLFVRMKINGRTVKRRSHRIVLSCFTGVLDNEKQVNHKNGVRNDNRIENLEWCTAKENVIHSYKVLGKKQSERQINSAKQRFSGENNPKSKINKEIAQCIVKDRRKGIPLKILSKKYNLSTAQISAIARGIFWKNNVFDNPELLEVCNERE